MAQELYFESDVKIKKVLNNDEIECIINFHDIDTNVNKIVKMIDRLNSKEEC